MRISPSRHIFFILENYLLAGKAKEGRIVYQAAFSENIKAIDNGNRRLLRRILLCLGNHFDDTCGCALRQRGRRQPSVQLMRLQVRVAQNKRMRGTQRAPLRTGQACRTRKQQRWGEQQRHRHRAHNRSKCLYLRMLCSCSVPLGLEGDLCSRQ